MVNSKEYLYILGLLYLIVHYLYNKTNVGTLFVCVCMLMLIGNCINRISCFYLLY